MSINISHSDLSEACRLKARPQKALQPRASPPPLGPLPRKKNFRWKWKQSSEAFHVQRKSETFIWLYSCKGRTKLSSVVFTTCCFFNNNNFISWTDFYLWLVPRQPPRIASQPRWTPSRSSQNWRELLREPLSPPLIGCRQRRRKSSVFRDFLKEFGHAFIETRLFLNFRLFYAFFP